MDLDRLIVMLESKKLGATRRREFDDKYEKYPPLMYAFALATIGEQYNTVGIAQHEKSYFEISKLPTTCWTQNDHESFLMWKSYTSKIGVCIKSSTHKMISALTSEDQANGKDYDVYFGSMAYGKVSKVPMGEDWMFWKDRAFSDEKEFRFYFEFKNDGNKCDSIKLIPINPSILIEKVILSPFIDINASQKLASMLQREYEINVEPSKIMLKPC